MKMPVVGVGAAVVQVVLMPTNKLYKFIRVEEGLWGALKLEAGWRKTSMVAVIKLGLEALRATKTPTLAGPSHAVPSRSPAAVVAPVQPMRELTYERDE